ncbi:MAG: hypothetical protein HS130_04185 [Deltaproteobacteria bacterium]|nr:hypothetical protein [Deltaproteobacteria bacterium]
MQDAPVALDYVIGPGDEMNVPCLGQDERTAAIRSRRNGTPGYRLAQVGGLTFAEMKKALAA